MCPFITIPLHCVFEFLDFRSHAKLAGVCRHCNHVARTAVDKFPPEVWEIFQRGNCPTPRLDFPGLRPFQATSVSWALRRKIVYIADEMGAGKTIQSLAVVSHFPGDLLIVCPAILRENWLCEVKHWLGTDAHVIKNKAGASDIRPVNIVSYNLLPVLPAHSFQKVIVDEAHYLKSRKSQRSKAILKFKNAPVKILLSGTPFAYLEDLYPQLKFLYPNVFRRFWDQKKFAFSRYVIPEETQFGMRFRRTRNEDELKAILGHIMIRRLKKDILRGLPVKEHRRVYLPISLKSEQKIARLLRGEEYMEAFRATGQAKQEPVASYLKEFAGDRCVIFVHHKEMRQKVETALPPGSFISIHGGVRDRHALVRAFQHMEYKYAVLSITAACTGLTLTSASRVIFTEILFGAEMNQAEDRVHRIGQKDDVEIIYLLAKGTTDLLNLGLVKRKEWEITKMTGKRKVRG